MGKGLTISKERGIEQRHGILWSGTEFVIGVQTETLHAAD